MDIFSWMRILNLFTGVRMIWYLLGCMIVIFVLWHFCPWDMCGCNLRFMIYKFISGVDILGIFCEIGLGWILQDLSGDQSTLVQVTAWCRCHYSRQCWPRSGYVDILLHYTTMLYILIPCVAIKFTHKVMTSNGSWCIGIKGEMSGTVCVTFTWDIYIYELFIAFVCFVVCSLL